MIKRTLSRDCSMFSIFELFLQAFPLVYDLYHKEKGPGYVAAIFQELVVTEPPCVQAL